MSETVSASSYYKSKGVKHTQMAKKTSRSKSAKNGNTKNTGTTKKVETVPKKSTAEIKKTDVQDKKPETVAKKSSAEIKKTAVQDRKPDTNSKRSVETKKSPKSKVALKATNGRKSLTSNIDENDINGLVEQFYQPGSKKKLTKEELQKKKELEAYLVRQLEQDDELGEEEDESEFSDEYTLDNSGSSSEEESDSDGEHDSETKDSGSYNASSGDSNAEAQLPNNSPHAQKVNKSNNKEKCIKRKSKEDPALSCTASAVCNSSGCKRRSMEPKGDASAHSTPQNVGTHNAGHVKLEPLSPSSNVSKMNSITEGIKVFRWLLNPVKVDDFFVKYWESNACLVKRQQSNYFKQLISFESIDQMLLKNHVEFTKNIDLTSYKNGVRETLNPTGRAMPPVVWEHYGRGCSIRLLNPQTFLPSLYRLSATLQEYFQCLVGANAYLTPPNSQGFAPHYDDIEAFVLQIEGRKHWKLYKPRNVSEELPRFSSDNFKQNEIGKPILEEVLTPGDILYFPRGTIHQAFTEPGYHSLHITLSVYQKQSYADLFERMVPLMLKKAIDASVEMRSGLPLHTWQHAGIAFSDNDTKERKQLVQKVTQLFSKFMRDIPIAEVMDAAVDQLAKKFQHEALPPEVLPAERIRTIFGSKSTTDERGECICDYEIDLRTNVRLLRANIMRLVHEEQKIRLYYYLNNSKEYCEYEPNYIEIDPEDAGSVEVLIKSYPAYVSVSQLPLSDDERKISMVTALWENGLLMLEKPLY